MSANYKAWLKTSDGTVYQWTGLRKTQALWRYNWIRRTWHEHRAKEWGWRAEA